MNCFTKTLLVSLMLVAGLASAAEPKFKKIIISDKFHGEGAAIGDFNHDGKPDIVAGHYWYEGPEFKTAHQIFEGKDFDPKGYSECFGIFADDFNGDGWTDILVCPHPGRTGFWYENPKGKDGLWVKHTATPELGNESPAYTDILGLKRPQLLYNRNKRLGLAIPNPEKPNDPWDFLPVSTEDKKWHKYTHGIGCGDINGDGRIDILESGGWYEQPQDYKRHNDQQTPWTFHPFPFATDAAHMLVYDVDGDGLNDVVTAVHCHLYGFAWYRQIKSDGKISFEKNELIPSQPADDFVPKVSQLHAMVKADVNGDGIPDVITGKRFWSHGPKGDVAPDDPALLMWWETKREGGREVGREGEQQKGGKAVLIPHVIDNDSGVGTQFAVGDLNGDGKVDIVIGNKKGTFIFMSEKENERP